MTVAYRRGPTRSQRVPSHRLHPTPDPHPHVACGRSTRVQAPWDQTQYRIRERKLTFGRQYYIEDAAGGQLGYVSQRWMRLKEAWTVFSDDTKTQVVFQVKATKVLDFQANIQIQMLRACFWAPSVARAGRAWSPTAGRCWMAAGRCLAN